VARFLTDLRVDLRVGALLGLRVGLLVGLLLALPLRAWAQPLQVGSKRFTESYILAELAVQTLRGAGLEAEHRQGLGNTAVVAAALQAGAVQLYPEYTGTLARELLRLDGQPSAAELEALLAARGLRIVARLGFHNGYALALREADAERLGLRTLSDLAALQAPLRIGLTHEFLQRADGWPALARAYGLAQSPGPALDHALALQALQSGQIDLSDVYTTDAQIERQRLRVLVDDRAFFPRYDAVLLARADLPEPARQALAALEGRIDAATMVRLNAQAELDGRPFAAVAQRFLAAQGATTAATTATTATTTAATTAEARPGFWQRLVEPDLPRLLGEHLLLVAGSVLLALAVGLPLALWADARPRAAALVRGAVGLLQTVPSLALLAVLVALLGRIGFWPALLALALYALLPIVANALAGLAGVPQGQAQAGRALGLSEAQLLRHVRLPLALPVLWTGVATAAVLNVGTATVAAFVGAGGLGERIVAGLAVNDPALMLAGALPAAVLALALQAAFGWGLGWLARRKGSGSHRA
jgi:osmoprotectant transport system permease protein